MHQYCLAIFLIATAIALTGLPPSTKDQQNLGQIAHQTFTRAWDLLSDFCEDTLSLYTISQVLDDDSLFLQPVPFAIGGRSKRRKHFHGVLLVEVCHLYTSAAYRFLAISLCLALLGFTKNATSGGALVRSSPKHATLVPRSKILPSSNQPSSPKTQASKSKTNTDAINILHIKEFQ